MKVSLRFLTVIAMSLAPPAAIAHVTVVEHGGHGEALMAIGLALVLLAAGTRLKAASNRRDSSR